MSIKENNLEVKKYNQSGEELAIRFGLAGIKAVGFGAMEEIVKNRNQNGKFKDIYDFAGKFSSKIINKKSIEALSKAGAFDEIHGNRRQIFDCSDSIIKYSAAIEGSRNSNQMSLFSGSNETEKPIIKQIEDWDKKDRLQKEFEAFGFFIDQHPIDDFLDDLAKRGVVSSEFLDDESISNDSIIKLAGVVAHSKHRSGPKGRYAYLTLSDPNSIFETSIFSEELITNSRDLMEAGTALVVECNIRKDDGGTRILVKNIEKIEDFIKNNKPRNLPYQDIKTNKRRGPEDKKEFYWQNKNKDKNLKIPDPILSWHQEQKKIEEFRAVPMLAEATIKVNNREAVLEIKSFLSQKLAPSSTEKFTKVFLVAEEIKIELLSKYFITENDLKQISSTDGVEILL